MCSLLPLKGIESAVTIHNGFHLDLVGVIKAGGRFGGASGVAISKEIVVSRSATDHLHE